MIVDQLRRILARVAALSLLLTQWQLTGTQQQGPAQAHSCVSKIQHQNTLCLCQYKHDQTCTFGVGEVLQATPNLPLHLILYMLG